MISLKLASREARLEESRYGREGVGRSQGRRQRKFRDGRGGAGVVEWKKTVGTEVVRRRSRE
jgi:hypothetical protein